MSNEGNEVVDFGAHLHPEATIPDAIRDRPLTRHLGTLEYDASALSDWFDAGGIDRAVLSQPFFMGHENASATAAANDALLDVLDAHSRYYGLAAVPVGAGGEAAAAELTRCLDAGYHGAGIETESHGVELTSREIEPVLEVANDTGAVLFVHPKLHDSLHSDVLDDKYLLNAIIGREAALLESICSVIHEDLFARYPDLKLVYHHLGGNLGSTMGRIALQLDPERWPGRQQYVKPIEEFRADLEDHIYVDTSGFFAYQTPLEAAVEELSAENVLLGTDTPYEPRTAEELSRFIDVVDETLTPEDARKVLFENAMDLLVNVDQ